jgi:hypothetical protein
MEIYALKLIFKAYVVVKLCRVKNQQLKQKNILKVNLTVLRV